MKNYTYNDEIYHAGVKGMKWSEEALRKRKKKYKYEDVPGRDETPLSKRPGYEGYTISAIAKRYRALQARKKHMASYTERDYEHDKHMEESRKRWKEKEEHDSHLDARDKRHSEYMAYKNEQRRKAEQKKAKEEHEKQSDERDKAHSEFAKKKREQRLAKNRKKRQDTEKKRNQYEYDKNLKAKNKDKAKNDSANEKETGYKYKKKFGSNAHKRNDSINVERSAGPKEAHRVGSSGRKRNDTGKKVSVKKRGEGLGKQSSRANNRFNSYENNDFFNLRWKTDEKFRQNNRNVVVSANPNARRGVYTNDTHGGTTHIVGSKQKTQLNLEKRRRKMIANSAYKRGRAYSRIRGKKKAGRRMFTEK